MFSVGLPRDDFVQPRSVAIGVPVSLKIFSLSVPDPFRFLTLNSLFFLFIFQLKEVVSCSYLANRLVVCLYMRQGNNRVFSLEMSLSAFVKDVERFL